MCISVCMASYNGQPYIARQLRSILSELGPEDEVVVVDDCSTDATVTLVRALRDPRIRLYQNDRNRREVYSFSRAMLLARNELIFLADQDDVWIPGRVALMTRALSTAAVVSTNFDWMDADEGPVSVPYDGVSSTQSTAHLRNIVDIFAGKTNYFGCAMALRRDFVPVVAPIPNYVESHDLWIALAGNVARSNAHLDQATLRKRQHGRNVTSTVSRRPLARKLWSRVVFAASLATVASRLWAEERLKRQPPIEKWRTG